MRIPASSPWLPGYIHVTQTVLVILVGLFPDRCHIYIHTHMYITLVLYINTVNTVYSIYGEVNSDKALSILGETPRPCLKENLRIYRQ